MLPDLQGIPSACRRQKPIFVARSPESGPTEPDATAALPVCSGEFLTRVDSRRPLSSPWVTIVDGRHPSRRGGKPLRKRMFPMKLYSGPLSLFSRKVEIALHEKGLAFERIMVRFTQTEGYHPKHPDVLAANPRGQVPVLVDGDLVLYDSTVILEYLEDAYPDPALYPRNAAERARCRLDELSADEVMLVPSAGADASHGPAPFRSRTLGVGRGEGGIGHVVLKDQLRALDRRLRGRSYLCGEFSVADIAMFMTVFFCQRLGGPALDGTPALFGLV